jgi:hypothetical protein
LALKRMVLRCNTNGTNDGNKVPNKWGLKGIFAGDIEKCPTAVEKGKLHVK